MNSDYPDKTLIQDLGEQELKELTLQEWKNHCRTKADKWFEENWEKQFELTTLELEKLSGESLVKLSKVADTRKEIAGLLDKSIITLAGGALFLSITFVKELAPSPTQEWLLAVAWIFLALSILLMLLHLVNATGALDVQWQIYEKNYKDLIKAKIRFEEAEEKSYSEEDSYKKRARTSNNQFKGAAFSLFAGIILLATFSFFNLPQANQKEVSATSTEQMDRSDQNTEEQVPPTPQQEAVDDTLTSPAQ